MTKEKFNQLLKQANLNKKQLADISGIPYPTINAWGSTTSYPPYIAFLLENYIKAQKYDKIKDLIKDDL
ncbi:terminase small subunit [Campylobacter coli]|uniref:Terminase small subunit n=1 Tax=Campylobacter coli TaxID=195 RepID=A0A691ZVK6_CAMCO|nr:acyl carrier protein [Campylobacter coli]EAK4321923.1 terminase small subunit [Campylobacter jejuni]EAC2153784.1 XRE family transcriptional regulator [Campylobacter coli]EAH4470499.1 XRE family transcriptional regulator [Campylobacter coli]EAH4475896.1 XRE family transcriptional regulator [Campylobacter coli]EAH4796998.1 XRE family transcriptional regulator [Campylobacter coli]